MALRDLIIHLGGIVTRRVDRALFDWMLAISDVVDLSTVPFDTIAVATPVGGQRLLDLTSVQLAALKAGDRVFVSNLKSFFVWKPTSTLTADNITVVNPTVNGANPGRFERDAVPDRTWMNQLNWFVDPANGAANDENTGDTAGAPLKTDAERQRRMGAYPTWNGGAYHLRYISSLPATDVFVLAGRRANNSQIFVHGSAIDHQGLATLYSGTIDALATLNRATGTNESWLITSNALPVSWTASGLLNSRIRLTSGTAGAISGVMKDLGAKQARVCQFRAPISYTVPVNPTAWAATSTPAATNTFVVESLVAIPNLLITIDAEDDFSTNLGSPVIFDSLAIGAGDFMMKCSDVVVFDGCVCTMFDIMGESDETVLTGSIAVTGLTIGPNHGIFLLAAGFSSVNVSQQVGSQQTIIQSDFMVQTGTFFVNGNCSWAKGAVFDSTASGIKVTSFGGLHGTTQAGSFAAWGKGNATVGLQAGERFTDYIAGQVAGWTITGTTTDFSIGGVTTVRPFDITTGAYLATTTTTWAHLAAAVGGGTGFGGNVHDPVGGGQLVVAN